MKLKQFFADDDAVSPVIGVILMVAITVILAAVIASFVLGLGDQNNPAPTADFTFDYTSGSPNTLDITFSEGDEIDGSQLFVRGQGISSSSNAPGTWNSIGGGSGDTSGGESITLDNVASDYVVNVVWEDPDSDSTSTLDTDEGPDA
jgi:flagellin-like protein